MPHTPTPWLTGSDAWQQFAKDHPELGYRGNIWSFHNFLRTRRNALLAAGVIRRATRGQWMVDSARFPAVAFELAMQPVFTAACDPCECSPCEVAA